jgi:hypothetical protein
MDLNVYRHEVGTGLGFGYLNDEPGFVPFSSQVTMYFDADVRERYPDYDNPEVHFDGNIQFVSPISLLLPWAPPFSTPATLARDLAMFSSSTETGSSGAAWQRFYEYFPDGDDYRYFSALYSNFNQTDPFVEMGPDFGPTDMLAYLNGLWTAGLPLEYQEDGWIYDGGLRQYVARDKYHAVATITSVAVVPVPAGMWLFASAIGTLLLRWAPRRPVPLRPATG